MNAEGNSLSISGHALSEEVLHILRNWTQIPLFCILSLLKLIANIFWVVDRFTSHVSIGSFVASFLPASSLQLSFTPN